MHTFLLEYLFIVWLTWDTQATISWATKISKTSEKKNFLVRLQKCKGNHFEKWENPIFSVSPVDVDCGKKKKKKGNQQAWSPLALLSGASIWLSVVLMLTLILSSELFRMKRVFAPFQPLYFPSPGQAYISSVTFLGSFFRHKCYGNITPRGTKRPLSDPARHVTTISKARFFENSNIQPKFSQTTHPAAPPRKKIHEVSPKHVGKFSNEPFPDLKRFSGKSRLFPASVTTVSQIHFSILTKRSSPAWQSFAKKPPKTCREEKTFQIVFWTLWLRKF